MTEHLHRFKKVNLTRDKKKDPFLVYKCTKANCTYYIRMDLAEGLMCECNVCCDAMVITKEVLTHSGRTQPMAKPRCPNCIRRKKANDVESIAAFLAEVEKKAIVEE